ncbi:IQ motif and SEC7 domain-containing protein 2-like protein [Lates japonicus]|uniref:IQ motif and SEC7 domain-containing protein 2-like protein n=1 Tax=Lates japonicus TaxID=270547 RepID=A0AAD3NHY7_LATJO|nr:IQ motif and SEC7 domain-containing protein 2-like protein [Lates japonicus]
MSSSDSTAWRSSRLQLYRVTASVQLCSRPANCHINNQWDEMSYSSSSTCSTTTTSCRSFNNPTSITTPSSTSSSSSSLYSSSLPPNSHATYHQYCCPARLRLPKPPCALPPAKHHEVKVSARVPPFLNTQPHPLQSPPPTHSASTHHTAPLVASSSSPTPRPHPAAGRAVTPNTQ